MAILKDYKVMTDGEIDIVLNEKHGDMIPKTSHQNINLKYYCMILVR